jgi:hypothetical protein
VIRKEPALGLDQRVDTGFADEIMLRQNAGADVMIPL